MAEPHPSITIHRRGFKAPLKEEPAPDESMRTSLKRHLERNLGPVGDHWTGVKQERIRLDFVVVDATYARDFVTVVTAGISDAPLNVPHDFELSPFIELMIALPRSWRMDEAAMNDPAFTWPLDGLAQLATFPHEYGTFLWEGHIIPNGDPAEPLGPNSEFVAWLIIPPVMAPPEALSFSVGPDKVINLIAAVPIYREEMELAKTDGLDALYKRFDRKEVTEIITPGRKNAAKRGFSLFG